MPCQLPQERPQSVLPFTEWSGLTGVVGAPPVLSLGLRALRVALQRGERVGVVDGANTFDPYLISRWAKGAGSFPWEWLRRVWVARAFTCYQAEVLLRDRLPRAIARHRLDRVILSAPAWTFYDPEVPPPEAVTRFRRAMGVVATLAERGHPMLVIYLVTDADARRPGLLEVLQQFARTIIAVEEHPAGPRVSVAHARHGSLEWVGPRPILVPGRARLRSSRQWQGRL